MMTTGSPIDLLKQAIAEFAARNPNSVHVLRKGHRLITEGEEGSDVFLIQYGYLAIFVNNPEDGKQREVALRYDGDLVGETAILQRRGRRNASVEVVSNTASLVTLSRQDILRLIRGNQAVAEAIIALWELAAARRSETLQVLGGDVTVETKVMSVLLGDIHNFSLLGEEVPDELSEAFLYEFIEESEVIVGDGDGTFEDQGDGFKAVFEGRNHVGRAVTCAASLHKSFCDLRAKWSKHNDAFHNIGLGIGVCTDCMSVRSKAGSARPGGRIASHAISVAAAIAKHKVKPSDVEVYLDENTGSMLTSNEFSVGSTEQMWLERIGRHQTVHKLTLEEPTSRLAPDNGIENDDNYNDIKEGAPISILFLAANPSDEARIRVDREVREIEQRLRLSRYRDRIALHQRHAVRRSDLSQALLETEPQIVHFSGHGAGAEGLCFEGEDGETRMVSTAALTALFKEFAAAIKCVILNTRECRVLGYFPAARDVRS